MTAAGASATTACIVQFATRSAAAQPATPEHQALGHHLARDASRGKRRRPAAHELAPARCRPARAAGWRCWHRPSAARAPTPRRRASPGARKRRGRWDRRSRPSRNQRAALRPLGADAPVDIGRRPADRRFGSADAERRRGAGRSRGARSLSDRGSPIPGFSSASVAKVIQASAGVGGIQTDERRRRHTDDRHRPPAQRERCGRHRGIRVEAGSPGRSEMTACARWRPRRSPEEAGADLRRDPKDGRSTRRDTRCMLTRSRSAPVPQPGPVWSPMPRRRRARASGRQGPAKSGTKRPTRSRRRLDRRRRGDRGRRPAAAGAAAHR